MEDGNSNIVNPFTFFPPPEVSLVRIPFVPSIVALDALDDDFRLLSAEKLEEMQSALENDREKTPRKEKEESGYATSLYNSHKKLGNKFPYSTIQFDNDLYPIYRNKKVETSRKNSNTVGAGTSGKVKAAQLGRTGEWYALKIQSLKEKEEKDQKFEQVKKEQEILSQEGNSPRNSPGMRRNSKGIEEFHILMKFAEGKTLGTLIQEEQIHNGYDDYYVTDPTIPPLIRLQMAIDVMEKVEKFIARGLLHRDLKLENIIYDIANMRAWLIDYGNVCNKNSEGNYIDQKLRATPVYVALELREERKRADSNHEVPKFVSNEKTEVFSLGIILAQLFGLFDVKKLPNKTPNNSKEDPFFVCNDTGVIKDKNDPFFIFNSTISLNQKNRAHLEAILTLAQRMTDVAANRPTLNEAIKELKRIKEDYLALSAEIDPRTKVRATVLDVDAFLKIDEDEQENFIDQLKDNVDQVMLIDLSGRERKLIEYAKIRRILEEDYHLLLYDDQVLVGVNEEAVKEKAKTSFKENEKFPMQYVEIAPMMKSILTALPHA